MLSARPPYHDPMLFPVARKSNTETAWSKLNGSTHLRTLNDWLVGQGKGRAWYTFCPALIPHVSIHASEESRGGEDAGRIAAFLEAVARCCGLTPNRSVSVVEFTRGNCIHVPFWTHMNASCVYLMKLHATRILFFVPISPISHATIKSICFCTFSDRNYSALYVAYLPHTPSIKSVQYARVHSDKGVMYVVCVTNTTLHQTHMPRIITSLRTRARTIAHVM